MRSKLLLLIALILIGVTAYPVDAGAVESKEGENASNPLAAVNNTDFRWQYFDLDGAYMVTPKLKLKYELHYWNTDVTGKSRSNWESFRLKPIYFLKDGPLGSWKYRLAVGFDWILDFGNEDRGIGSGSDQIAPFVGFAFMSGKGMVLIPLVQHFMEYSGPTVNTTAFRLIALQKLPKQFWVKLDAKVPVDWEHDDAIPATVEVQLGKMFDKQFGAYVDLLAGVGNDRPYDWGAGVGLRVNY